MASVAMNLHDLGLTTSISQTRSVSPQELLMAGSQAHSQSEIGHHLTPVLSESRPVRVVLYSATPAQSEHRFWIDPQVTFGSVAQALAEMYPSQELVVLQANWGPRPYWAESHPDLLIGSTCQVLYAILKDQTKPYTMGVVRTSLSDYPIPIYTPEPGCSTTLLGAVIASYPKLTGQIKSIVPYVDDHDIQDIPHNNDLVASRLSPATHVFINTLDEPPKELMVGSLYESFSPSSPKASTSSDSDGLIPPLLQISFVECKLLVQRAYELDAFPLQMIHLSRALLHVIISLARDLTPAFGENVSIIGAALNADDDLAGLLRVAPHLLRQLEELLDAANAIVGNLASGSFNREETQDAIENMFVTLCGDFPGAVTVRHSEKVFKKLCCIDCEELDTLALEGMKMTYPEISPAERKVAHSDPMIYSDRGNGFRHRLVPAYNSRVNRNFTSSHTAPSSSLAPFNYVSSPHALLAPSAPSSSQIVTGPVRGADNEHWISSCFWHLPPTEAALKRTQLRTLIYSHPWHHNLPLRSPTDLDWFVLRRNAKTLRCEFCLRDHPNGASAKQCVQGHLNYNPTL